jgi:hypothetical protein
MDHDTLFIGALLILTFIWLMLPPDDGAEA